MRSFLFLLLTLSGFMGSKTGVPFPVMSRISFGTRGAQIPALIRGGVAIVWFGIQTYLASLVCNVLLIELMPSLEPLSQQDFLGLSLLGWISFTILWIVQVIIASYGMESHPQVRGLRRPGHPGHLRRAGRLGLLRRRRQIVWEPPNAVTGGEMWAQILGGASLWVAIYGTFVLNFCDFTRGAKSKRAIVRGNFWGIPINMMIFGLIVVILTGGQLAIDGTLIDEPDRRRAEDPEHAAAGAGLPRAADPDHRGQPDGELRRPVVRAGQPDAPASLNFRRAAVVSAIIGFVILPWNLYTHRS